MKSTCTSCLFMACKNGEKKPELAAGFANEAQLLAVNEASLQDLNSRLSRHAEGRTPTEMTLEQFRPNLIIGGNLTPFCEDRWNRLLIGQLPFDVAGRPSRPQLIPGLCNPFLPAIQRQSPSGDYQILHWKTAPEGSLTQSHLTIVSGLFNLGCLQASLLSMMLEVLRL